MSETDVQSTSHLTNETVVEESLSDTFDRCLELHYVVDESESSSEKLKNDVNSGVHQLEEATRKVNMLNLFSKNESIDEVATGDLKYLLLPALLGSFTMKKSTSTPQERNEVLSLAELYFTDYLQRFKDYDVSNVDCLKESSFNDDVILSNDASMLPPKLMNLAKHRECKIAQYKRLKALCEREKDLHNAMKSKKDDEVVREYFIVLLKKWALIASQELENIKMEKEVLQHFTQSVSLSKNARAQEKPKPLQPVIITRNELQKKVYGLGYPSVPVMTVNEFYQQRYPENSESEPRSAAEMSNLMYIAANPDFHKRELEQEDEEKERKVENDDPELLQHTRAFDDWKDVNRRGCGNRKNKC